MSEVLISIAAIAAALFVAWRVRRWRNARRYWVSMIVDFERGTSTLTVRDHKGLMYDMIHAIYPRKDQPAETRISTKEGYAKSDQLVTSAWLELKP